MNSFFIDKEVAFKSPTILLFRYHSSTNKCVEHLTLNEHLAEVHDIAFTKIDDRLSLISGSSDETVRVWDVETGNNLHTFSGHIGPVFTICARLKDDVPFLFSASQGGDIKIWLFEEDGLRGTFKAPGKWCTCIAASDDRLFSCGVGKGSLVEWNETEGKIQRKYEGYMNEKDRIVRFDMAHNFLALGDGHEVKFWHMDREIMLATVDPAVGQITAVGLNNDGYLLAVIGESNDIKIFSNTSGLAQLNEHS